MKELELLGLQPDGEKLTLNDAEGNRYSLAITDDLRAALRRDRHAATSGSSAPQQMTPREIQAYIREGKSVEEVSELASLPPSRIEPLAYPIVRERSYTAATARAFLMGSEPGAMTLEELVAGRLAGRGVAASDIEWDAVRTKGEPWTLLVHFPTAEREHQASWHVDFEAQSLTALDEEAIWLSETPILPERTWRAPNTPAVSSLEEAPSLRSPAPVPTPPLREEEAVEAPQSTSPEAAPSRIDAVLASLDAQRGVPSPMPGTAEAEAAQVLDADILALPDRGEEGTFDLPPRPERTPAHTSVDSPASAAQEASTSASSAESPAAKDSAPTPSDATEAHEAADSQANATADAGEEGGAQAALFETDEASAPAPKRVRKSNRPSVPTWDEIVFGKKDS